MHNKYIKSKTKTRNIATKITGKSKKN